MLASVSVEEGQTGYTCNAGLWELRQEVARHLEKLYGVSYAFPSIHHSGMTSNEFSERLLKEEKVAVIPGNAFGQCGEGFIRCSYVASLADIEEALERMGRFARRHG